MGKRIICDAWFQNKALFGREPDSKINKRITAVNAMYNWLNQRKLLKPLAFVWREFDGGVAFGLDVANLLPYREEMLHSGTVDAELAVREIFDEDYQTCRFCGAITLSWPMHCWRSEYGASADRSWEARMVQALPTHAADDVQWILECNGPIAAVEEVFRYFRWRDFICDKEVRVA